MKQSEKLYEIKPPLKKIRPISNEYGLFAQELDRIQGYRDLYATFNPTVAQNGSGTLPRTIHKIGLPETVEGIKKPKVIEYVKKFDNEKDLSPSTTPNISAPSAV